MDVPTLTTPREAAMALGTRLRELRLAEGWKRATLAQRAGVSEASLKRFERTGQISLESLLRLCHALWRLDEFMGLLQPAPARTLAELEARVDRRARQRGRL